MCSSPGHAQTLLSGPQKGSEANNTSESERGPTPAHSGTPDPQAFTTCKLCSLFPPWHLTFLEGKQKGRSPGNYSEDLWKHWQATKLDMG